MTYHITYCIILYTRTYILYIYIVHKHDKHLVYIDISTVFLIRQVCSALPPSSAGLIFLQKDRGGRSSRDARLSGQHEQILREGFRAHQERDWAREYFRKTPQWDWFVVVIPIGLETNIIRWVEFMSFRCLSSPTWSLLHQDWFRPLIF